MVVAERLSDHLHPLLAALRDAPDGEPAFWARVSELRAPLIEPDPASAEHSLVTFVFQDADAGHVVVQPGFGDLPDNVMDRIPGTGVWHAAYRYRNDVRVTYSFGPNLPLASFRDADETKWAQLRAFTRDNPQPLPDPHRRATFVSRAGEGLPDNVASILSLPNAPDQSITAKRDGVARGWIERHQFKSAVMGNERRVWVYTPPGYAPEERSYPLIVAFDGGAALALMPTHRVLDNLLADGKIAPAVAVFVDNATDTSRNHELPCNEDFARFIETELVPWVLETYAVSHDPADGFVTGVSYGGLASMWLGYRLPHIFGNVISQAASLWWGPGFDGEKPLPLQRYAPEWLVDQYAAAPRLPLRLWMEIGLMEPQDRMVEPNRRMAEVLRGKGCDLTYSEFAAGHDYALWRVTMAEALTTMLPPTAL
jgi:enterochelin esterase family protein